MRCPDHAAGHDGERLKVTAGARYTWKRRSIDGDQISPANFVTTSTDQSRLLESSTARANADIAWSPDGLQWWPVVKACDIVEKLRA